MSGFILKIFQNIQEPKEQTTFQQTKAKLGAWQANRQQIHTFPFRPTTQTVTNNIYMRNIEESIDPGTELDQRSPDPAETMLELKVGNMKHGQTGLVTK